MVKGYFIDTTNHAHTINLPSSCEHWRYNFNKRLRRKFGTNSVTIGRNGHKIQGDTVNSVLSTNVAQ